MEHLKIAKKNKVRSTCNDHRAVNLANKDQQHLNATGIGATAYAQHGVFCPGAVVDFQKVKCHQDICFPRYAPAMSKSYRQEILDDHMFPALCKKFKKVQQGLLSSKLAFEKINSTADFKDTEAWIAQEKRHSKTGCIKKMPWIYMKSLWQNYPAKQKSSYIYRNRKQEMEWFEEPLLCYQWV
ncbi:hypothetical protein SERLA73DRAFT_156749 [Serpula lacrymans var. lacrymans S7.3]|uniref:Uncharacterized protein n=1 Tax=Serpula lacrymans var. lacrymans (strain S7.3) TaxID=936435 RepID=F8QFV5_SERL3|nr:hypothetical protein SERLA73DRAFT_156749 [Serpula lacrymans var. lacrymans S7.3]